MNNLHKAIWEMFDDFHQPSAKGAAYPTPFLWAEEAHADAAVYEEQKQMNEWFYKFGSDIMDVKQSKVAKVLAKLAEENHWTHNDVAWHQLQEHRFKIDPTPDKQLARVKRESKEHVPTSDTLDIDKRELARMMGDMLDDDIYHVEPLSYHGDDLVGFVCAMLADENGWKMTEPYSFIGHPLPKVYRI
jgi:hypothetical protein